MNYGDALRQAREAQGLSTQDLALRTKIRGDYLRALEDGNIALLPERTFARSYLQRYARELKIDPAPLLADFDRSVPSTQDLGMTRPSRTAAPVSRRASPLVALLAGLLVLGGAGYGVYRYLAPGIQTGSPTEAAQAGSTPVPATDPTPAAPEPVRTVKLSVSSVPSGARVYLDNRDLGLTPLRSFPVEAREDAQLRVEYTGRQPLKQSVSLTQGRNLRARLLPPGQGASELTDLAVPTPKPVVKPGVPASGGGPAENSVTTPSPEAAPGTPVSVQFTAEAWTRVTDASGRVLYEGIPPAGTRKGFPAGVTVRTGNAGAVRVSVKGSAFKALGEAGQVVSRQF
ncbi:helix-turn-helix domain-containing protein [Deinococcus deserti]|uniref:HTH cro/C1-type domain-containing protein n=1 Tax=Deinococcus deserti (strain DSM 17065 / CIP 109153 / LMG 22923 / VCD115) TaxID=546414 RepID=C1D1C0_DEIDV|nr:helix-turn-helix domain-containing protein [Deinococcus deserti]ACO45644.1 hypothetical protein Deide_07800 [Deinococcus deserti VCD115]